MNLSTEFIYNVGNIYLYSMESNAFVAMVGVGICMIVTVLFYMVSTYILGNMILKKEAKLLEHKKSVLQELIVMKDIQTEIEKEIEKAMLNETFNG